MTSTPEDAETTTATETAGVAETSRTGDGSEVGWLHHGSDPSRAGAGSHPASDELPVAVNAARLVFGDRLPLAERYADELADTGVSHGLIGPREVPRLWERHLLNCGVVARLLPDDCDVIDVGSGAGLPGLVLAIARPDCRVTLVEPMLRRTRWLESTVGVLGLTNVEVRRGRAEAFWDELSAPVVTARAVARLDELALWCLPLVAPDGVLLAMKGSSAAEEVDLAAEVLADAGVVETEIVTLGDGLLDSVTTVVRARVGPQRRTASRWGSETPRKVSRPVRRRRKG